MDNQAALKIYLLLVVAFIGHPHCQGATDNAVAFLYLPEIVCNGNFLFYRFIYNNFYVISIIKSIVVFIYIFDIIFSVCISFYIFILVSVSIFDIFQIQRGKGLEAIQQSIYKQLKGPKRELNIPRWREVKFSRAPQAFVRYIQSPHDLLIEFSVTVVTSS